MKARALKPFTGQHGRFRRGQEFSAPEAYVQYLARKGMAVPLEAAKSASPRPSTWWPDWQGETVVIVAGGPSVNGIDLDQIRDRARLIAINNAMLRLPWADIGYACDMSWWARYHDQLGDFSGIKLTVDKAACRRFFDLHPVGLNKNNDHLEVMKFGTVGWAGNSGFHCLNLAVQFLVSKIILVGYDMTLSHGVHWHGKHPDGMNNPSNGNVERWRRCVDGAADLIAALGIRAINASPISALQNYPKMSLEEALTC